MKVQVKGKEVLIDKDSLSLFESRVWHISDTGYVVWRGVENGKKRTIRFHREVMGAENNEIVDHINRNKLDNRRANMRIVTQKENARNSDRYEQYKGYYYDNTKKRWAIDTKTYGIKSLYMDSEYDCKRYIKALKEGDTPIRVFTKRPSLGGRKLTDENIEYIFNKYDDGETRTSIASKLNVSRSAVGRVISGKTTMGGRISRRTKKAANE